MTMTKGNDGRAARLLLWKRLFFVISCFLCFILVLNLLGIGGNSWRRNDLKNYTSLRNRGRGGKADPTNRGHGPRLIQVDIETDEQVLDKILSASIHLINIQSPEGPRISEDGTYSSIYADFCEINFAVHKQDPSSVPMFRDVISHSPDCDVQRYRVDLAKIVALARSFDNEDGALLGLTKSLELGGVVFHESRCGSTLVANALIGMNPQKHRVYSESPPPILALRGICGETFSSCSMETAVQLLSDTLYLMGRTNDLHEERVFYKIQSVGTRSLSVFQQAFPNTPWIFVYRDPVQVLMSQLAQGSKNANCVQGRQQPPKITSDIATKAGFQVRHLSNVEYCAAHLASLTESAVAALVRAPDMGMAVNYKSLPDILFTQVLPDHFNIPVAEEEKANILQISSVYSKGRGNRAGEWHQDSERKEERASPEIHKAADLFLRDSYELLQGEAQHDDALR